MKNENKEYSNYNRNKKFQSSSDYSFISYIIHILICFTSFYLKRKIFISFTYSIILNIIKNDDFLL
jgi:hypothetical protein